MIALQLLAPWPRPSRPAGPTLKALDPLLGRDGERAQGGDAVGRPPRPRLVQTIASYLAVGALLSPVSCALPRSSRAPPLLAPISGSECEPLGRVSGLATAAEHLGYDQELYLATRDAIAEARSLGATHVVLDREEGAPSLMRLSGFAYRCQ